MDEIIGEFLVESYEGLDRLDQAFIDLEETPDDIGTLTEAFRILHTIKGTCGFLGFGQLEKVAHRGENLLSLLRDEVLEMNNEIADALLATVDAIREILSVIEGTEEEGQHDNDELIALLEQLSGQSPAAPPAPPAQEAAPAEPVAEAPASDPVAEAPATEDTAADAPDAESGSASEGVVLLNPPDAPADPGADVPDGGVVLLNPPAETGDGTLADAFQAADALAGETPDGGATEGSASTSDETGTDPAAEDTTAATADADGDRGRIGDILVSEGAAARTDVEIAATEQVLGDKRKIGKILSDDGKAEQAEVEKAASRQRGAADASIRVDVAVLDTLMNLVGELVLSRNQIVQLASDEENREFAGPAQRLNLITSELQEGVMRTRMQPIGNVWNKLPRVVRDLAQQFGKQISLEMEGKGTELDRTILEAIKDPLTHMVRNTVDHGIEDPETRKAVGKNPEGVLKLAASHEGGQVNIEISDDGAGIDPDRMRTKAVEKGIITTEAAAKMSDNEAVQLIFAPGFSTAAKVSNVSGRGVGMDVVRTNVERIGGSVDVKSVSGQGTVFKIKIPLTLAIIPAITVRCGGNRYAIPQVSLQELVRLDGNDLSSRIEDLHGAPVYRLRERLLPIIDLREQLGAEPDEQSTSTNIVVLQIDGKPFGLVVDHIENTEEIVVKPLGREVKDISLFSGATIMGDGKVALILDVIGLAAGADIVNAGRQGDASADGTSATFEAEEEVLDDRTLLLVDFDDDNRAAIPLSAIERLEEFDADQIEDSGHQTVVQYRDSILPVLDLGPTTGMGGSALNSEVRINAVVCNFHGISVGLAVGSILDIVSHAEVHQTAGGTIETAIINGQVTDVIDVDGLLQQHFPMAEPIGEFV
ncbi:MAG: chemotaxis protein CheW [Actinomycetota bacterium]